MPSESALSAMRLMMSLFHAMSVENFDHSQGTSDNASLDRFPVWGNFNRQFGPNEILLLENNASSDEIMEQAFEMVYRQVMSTGPIHWNDRVPEDLAIDYSYGEPPGTFNVPGKNTLMTRCMQVALRNIDDFRFDDPRHLVHLLWLCIADGASERDLREWIALTRRTPHPPHVVLWLNRLERGLGVRSSIVASFRPRADAIRGSLPRPGLPRGGTWYQHDMAELGSAIDAANDFAGAERFTLPTGRCRAMAASTGRVCRRKAARHSHLCSTHIAMG